MYFFYCNGFLEKCQSDFSLFPKEKPPRTDSFCSGRDRVYAYPAVPPKLLPAAITRQPLSSLTRIHRMRLGKRVSAPAQECSFLPRGFCAWLSAGGHASLVENAGYSSLSLPFCFGWMGLYRIRMKLSSVFFRFLFKTSPVLSVYEGLYCFPSFFAWV